MNNDEQLQGVADRLFLQDIRRPALGVYLYDRTDTLSEIVLGTNSQVPLNLTDCVVSVSLSFSEDSAATCRLSLVPNPNWENEIYPEFFYGQPIIRVKYAIPNIGETWIFTGPAIGQPGFRKNRETNERIIEVYCIDRSFYFNNERKLNSPAYVQNTDLGDVALDVATNGNYGMGLEPEECRFGLFRHVVAHTKVYLADITYLEGLKFLGFIVGRAPYFDGDGALSMRDISLTKPPVRVYQDESLFLSLEWPQGKVDIKNQVKIIGIDSAMSKVISPIQELATVRGTIGFFEEQYKTRVFFSEDHQGRAQNVAITSKSINGYLGSLGGGMHLTEIDEFSCVLIIDTPYQQWIFVIWFAVYIDFFIVSAALGPLGSLFGLDDIAFLAAAVWLTAGLMVMQQMGSFETTISGEPYKLVYKEIEGKATWAELNDYEIRPMTIENHLVDSQALADSLAFRELKREACKQAPRNLTIPYDPFLAVTDIIELPDGTRYYITGISVSFKRGDACNMDLSCLKVRDGKEYNDLAGYSDY